MEPLEKVKASMEADMQAVKAEEAAMDQDWDIYQEFFRGNAYMEVDIESVDGLLNFDRNDDEYLNANQVSQEEKSNSSHDSDWNVYQGVFQGNAYLDSEPPLEEDLCSPEYEALHEEDSPMPEDVDVGDLWSGGESTEENADYNRSDLEDWEVNNTLPPDYLEEAEEWEKQPGVICYGRRPQRHFEIEHVHGNVEPVVEEDDEEREADEAMANAAAFVNAAAGRVLNQEIVPLPIGQPFDHLHGPVRQEAVPSSQPVNEAFVNFMTRFADSLLGSAAPVTADNEESQDAAADQPDDNFIPDHWEEFVLDEPTEDQVEPVPVAKQGEEDEDTASGITSSLDLMLSLDDNQPSTSGTASGRTSTRSGKISGATSARSQTTTLERQYHPLEPEGEARTAMSQTTERFIYSDLFELDGLMAEQARLAIKEKRKNKKKLKKMSRDNKPDPAPTVEQQKDEEAAKPMPGDDEPDPEPAVKQEEREEKSEIVSSDNEPDPGPATSQEKGETPKMSRRERIRRGRRERRRRLRARRAGCENEEAPKEPQEKDVTKGAIKRTVNLESKKGKKKSSRRRAAAPERVVMSPNDIDSSDSSDSDISTSDEETRRVILMQKLKIQREVRALESGRIRRPTIPRRRTTEAERRALQRRMEEIDKDMEREKSELQKKIDEKHMSEMQQYGAPGIRILDREQYSNVPRHRQRLRHRVYLPQSKRLVTVPKRFEARKEGKRELSTPDTEDTPGDQSEEMEKMDSPKQSEDEDEEIDVEKESEEEEKILKDAKETEDVDEKERVEESSESPD